jgi:hypothetical protein
VEDFYDLLAKCWTKVEPEQLSKLLETQLVSIICAIEEGEGYPIKLANGLNATLYISTNARTQHVNTACQHFWNLFTLLYTHAFILEVHVKGDIVYLVSTSDRLYCGTIQNLIEQPSTLDSFDFVVYHERGYRSDRREGHAIAEAVKQGESPEAYILVALDHDY